MLMILITSRLQGRELKPVNCMQVQDHWRFIDFTSERDVYARFLFVRSFYESNIIHHSIYAYLRNDRKIKFRMASAQHFINEAPGLLLSGPKSSFQMKVNFAFHLEIKVPESGGRVERHRIHVAWSPVWSFHSQWWVGLPCHLLVLVHCVFWSPQSTQPSTRKF